MTTNTTSINNDPQTVGDGKLDHAGLLALSKNLHRPLYTLTVTSQDPFTAGQPARRAGAEWFASLWRKFKLKPGAHIRRIHYKLISQAKPVLMPDGLPYENVDRPCYDLLNKSSLDARYLGLIKPEWLVDRRNAEPVIAPNQDATAPGLISNGGLSDAEALFEVPYLSINAPTIPQRYLVEVWCEKSTMNDILLPLGERYGVNIVTGIGELSLTRCVELVTRAEESERPVRILYVSDFDPAGASMPVAVARKIEFALGGRDLDIQVRPVVLTHEQCIEYRLPRTPIKDTEGRAGAFEARFGAGATELDALEALHEGELERILVKEVMRYYDDDLDARIDDIANDVQADLDAVNKTVHRRHAKAITALKTDHKALTAKINKLVKEFEKKANPILRKIEQDLEAEAPDVNAYDWPEPDDGDEDDDPLFDSTREYLDQIEHYKNHQGKPTESTRKPYDFSPAKCVVCGKAFRATSRNKLMVCSGLCRQARLRLAAAPDPIPCAICGKKFKAIRGATVCSNNNCRNEARRRKRARQ